MQDAKLTHLSLFSGIGGLDLAAEWAGFTTVGQCEWADYPTKVLEKHWPDVQRWRDIRTLTKESFYERTVLRTVDVISGGFPCQPFSVAGKRRGEEDDRYLWPEMLRVISELRPTWVFGENVAGIVNMALDQVLSGLESIGYACQAFIIPACAVDAPHRRDRCAILGYSEHNGLSPAKISGGTAKAGTNEPKGQEQTWKFAGTGKRGNDEIVAYTNSAGVQRRTKTGKTRSERQKTEQFIERCVTSGNASKPGLGRVADGPTYWMDEPLDIPRVANGVPNRVDRLKCLGNMVVPQWAYPIFNAIAKIEMGGYGNE